MSNSVQLKHVLKQGSSHSFYGTQVILGIISVLMCAGIGKLSNAQKKSILQPSERFPSLSSITGENFHYSIFRCFPFSLSLSVCLLLCPKKLLCLLSSSLHILFVNIFCDHDVTFADSRLNSTVLVFIHTTR